MEAILRIGCDDSLPQFNDQKRRRVTASSTTKKFRCGICGPESTTYPSPSALASHMQSHRVPTNFICSACSKTFISRKFLMNHLTRSTCATKSKDPLVGSEILSVVKETHKVQFINGGFKADQEEPLKSATSVGEVVSFKIDGITCSTCRAFFSSHDYFLKHFEANQCNYSGYEIYQLESQKETLKCQFCSAVLSTTIERFDHIVRHMTCKDCDNQRAFKGIQDKRLHMKMTHGKSPCYACHLDFTSNVNLKKHMNISHPDLLVPKDLSLQRLVLKKVQMEMSFEAIEDLMLTTFPRMACDVDAIWRANLKQILCKVFSKTEENRFKPQNMKGSSFLGLCPGCGAIFKNKFALESHCKMCTALIRNPLQLEKNTRKKKRAKRTFSPAFRHPCSLCSSKFHFKVELRAHMHKAHQEKYVCEHCHQSLATEGFLRRHLDICSNKVYALIFRQDEDDD